jgi:diguanylate cyclase (GGDEF)-like protein
VTSFAEETFQVAARGAVPIAVSVGVAAYPQDARTAGELIGVADEALYRVKRAGGNGLAAGRDADASRAPEPLRAAG